MSKQSVCMASDANWSEQEQAVSERFQYEPYGQVAVAEKADAGSGADGHAWHCLHEGLPWDDAVSGLYHFRNRDYSPSLGRWVQQDPMGYVDGMSLYEYVKSAPAGQLDPAGLETRIPGRYEPGRPVKLGGPWVPDPVPTTPLSPPAPPTPTPPSPPTTQPFPPTAFPRPGQPATQPSGSLYYKILKVELARTGSSTTQPYVRAGARSNDAIKIGPGDVPIYVEANASIIVGPCTQVTWQLVRQGDSENNYKDIPVGPVTTLDRLGWFNMNQPDEERGPRGRVRYNIEAAGVEHESTIKSLSHK